MSLLRKFERVYIVISLMFFANGVFQHAVAENDNTVDTSTNMEGQVVQLILYAILAVLVAIHWREVFRGLQRSGWMIALCGLTVISAAWSGDPAFTARRGILLSCLTLFAIYLASCFDWDEQLNLYGWAALISVAGSIFMAVVLPSYGISQDVHSGSVKGMFPHRSVMARQMVFAILTLWLGRPRALPYWIRYGALAGAWILLFLSHAATSALVMLVCLLLYPIINLARLRNRRTLPLWVALVPVVVMVFAAVILNFGLVLGVVGRSETLTGRFPIWGAVLHAIGNRPWLGYGLDNFWHHYTAEIMMLRATVSWVPPHAHDGYLDILISVGVVGLAIFAAGFVTNLSRAFWMFKSTMRGGKWPLFVLLFFAFFNLTESNILRPMTFLWVPYVSIYVTLGLLMQERRQTAAKESQLYVEHDGWSEVPSAVKQIVPSYGTEGLPQ